MNEPLSIPEAVCRAMNTAVEWTLDASTAHIPKNGNRKLAVLVNVPGERLPVRIVMNQCLSCTMVSGIEEGNKVPCPYCRSDKLTAMEG